MDNKKETDLNAFPPAYFINLLNGDTIIAMGREAGKLFKVIYPIKFSLVYMEGELVRSYRPWLTTDVSVQTYINKYHIIAMHLVTDKSILENYYECIAEETNEMSSDVKKETHRGPGRLQ